MQQPFDADAQDRLRRYFDEVGAVLGRKENRASFATYAMGILGDGERKSVEPIAARASGGDPAIAGRLHDNLLSFLTDAKWADRSVRRLAAKHVLAAIKRDGPVQAWIIDDTGFLKQGEHSVGVQRQYTGSAGKTTNCQVAVSLTVASRTEHAPIDFALYLPRSWADDVERRREARIPDEVSFRTKPELALEMIGRALEDGVEAAPVLADSAYGDASDFRGGLRALGLKYSVGIKGPTKVRRVGAKGRAFGEAISVAELAPELRFRRVTWRDGTNGKLWSRFARVRVITVRDEKNPTTEKPFAEWLLVEWPPGEAAPTKFTLSTLPIRTSMRSLVRMTKDRWRTERAYEDLKGELGLDHYEGRRFPGWHHHISVVLCCYAFVVAERWRHFPPSARRQSHPGPVSIAA